MAGRNRTAVIAFKRLKATRPEVMRVLFCVEEMGWGWLIEFKGSREALLAAGVAEEEMFALPRRGRKAARDQFGDGYRIRERHDGTYALERHLSFEAYDLCGPRGRSWKTLGAGVVAEVDAALERMRRPRKAAL